MLTASGRAPRLASGEERVVVAVRLRPYSGEQPALVRHEGNSVVVRDHTFTFDHVYGPEVGQEKVYADLGSPILHHALRGFNGTILAYGQTGSGKTFTMLGGEDAAPELLAASAGIVPRLSRELFALLDAERAAQGESGPRILVSASFLEVYNEVLYDLLQTQAQGGMGDEQRAPQQLEVRESAATGVRVHGLTEAPVASERELLRVVSSGHRRRATGSTAMNARSSRSHAVFCVSVLRKEVDGRELRARLSLVDLAGSERTGELGARGGQFREGVAINKSLSALGAVINALAARSNGSGGSLFVPYRNSKLTRVLQGSLGGNSLTAMVGTVALAPACAEDSLSTLQYAERAKLIPVHATANEGGGNGGNGGNGGGLGAGGGQEARALRAQVRALQAELAAAASAAAGTLGEDGEGHAIGRQLRQRLDDTQYALQQTFEEKERIGRELASARRANAAARAAARRERRAEREDARQRLLGEQVHGHWLRALSLSEPLWAAALPALPRAAAGAQLALSEAELRFCQARSFAAMLVGALGEQAAQLHSLALEAQEGGGAGARPGCAAVLTAEHSQLHTLRQIELKLAALHGECGRGLELRAHAAAAYRRAFALLDEARAQLARGSAATLTRGWRGAEGSAAAEEAEEEEAEEEAQSHSEDYAEGLLDVACAREQLSRWRAQLLSAAPQGSQLLVTLSELCAVLLAALQAHRAQLLPRHGAAAGASGAGLVEGGGEAADADADAADAAERRRAALSEELAEAVELGGTVRAHLADIAPGSRKRHGTSPGRAGDPDDADGAAPPEQLGMLSAPVHASLLQVVRALEAALSHALRQRDRAAARHGEPHAEARPAGAREQAAASAAPAGGAAGDEVLSAAARRAARQRRLHTSTDEQADTLLASSGSVPAPPAAQPRPGHAASGGSRGSPLLSEASSWPSDAGGADVAALEEQLAQAGQRLRASDEALERATQAARAAAERAAELDSARAALVAQAQAQAVESDDQWREVATLHAELREASDKSVLFYDWLRQMRENLVVGGEGAGGEGGGGGADGAGGEVDHFSSALALALRLVEERYVADFRLAPAQAHVSAPAASPGWSGTIPKAASKARRAYSSLFAAQPAPAHPSAPGLGARPGSRCGSAAAAGPLERAASTDAVRALGGGAGGERGARGELQLPSVADSRSAHTS